MDIKRISLTVNGKEYNLLVGDDSIEGVIPNSEVLVKTLRNRLNLTGTKDACEEGACGCCTVIMNGDPVTSCMILTADCDGAEITTIEGLEDAITGELDPLQQAFIDKYAFQCGYCTPGIIMSAKALLNVNPNPTHEEIGEALSGNFCRCISHYHVFEAVEQVINQGR
ncbi:MAG: (2Fe-2S)-binding protein [Lachnospiraceae bacterium]|jgi:carbon-monoxide dehydrogenase small subunit